MGRFKKGIRIYNLFPRLVGTFPEWLAHCRRAKEMGFNWIFINPVSRTGYSGSLYAVKDYYRINPLFVEGGEEAGPAELAAFKEGAHRLGLKLMADLVINHTAYDSVLTEAHPEWFVRGVDGKIQHPFCIDPPGSDHIRVWEDLAEIDNAASHEKDALWKYWLELVGHYIDAGWDGFRCDAAYQVPPDLWREILTSAREKKRDVIFAAETLGCTEEQTLATAACGFDYIFNNSRWWDMKSPWLLRQYEMTRKMVPSISFPETHDTTRTAADAHADPRVSKMRYLFAAVYGTGVMIPVGYEFGFRKKLDVLWTSPENWEEPSFDISEFIAGANKMKASHRVFNEEGPQERIEGFDSDVLVMKRSTNDCGQKALVVLNGSAAKDHDVVIESLGALLETGAGGKDVSPEDRMAKVPDRLELKLGPLQARVLVFGK